MELQMTRQTNIDYSNFETLGEIKNKYPDSTFVMRKQFIDMAIQHEWNHGRPVGRQLGVCTELGPRCNAKVVARVMADRLIAPLISELDKLISEYAEELGKLHVRVSFYKEPKM